MSTIDRTNPGALAAGTGLSFRTDLNNDRAEVYEDLTQLESEMEVLATELLVDGTLPSNTALCYIDNPTAGRVYCPVGYLALVGGVPVETTAILNQGYTGAALNHVYLVVATDGALTLRVATGAVAAGSNELWIADVTAVPAIDNAPAGKITAGLPTASIADLAVTAAKLAAAVSSMIQGTPAFVVGAEAGNVINVSAQLKDVAGNNIAAKHMIHAWLSDTAGGEATATEPDGGAAIGTNGVIVNAGHLQDWYWEIVTSATGQADLNITHSLAQTWYLNLEYQGKVFSSAAITFV